MQKRYLAAALAALLVLAVALPALAATGDQDNAGWFNRMFQWHQEQVKQGVDSGQLTPEQGQAWNRHFDQMRQFHTQNGFQCPGFGGAGGNGTPGPAASSRGGMMGGWRGMMGSF